MATNDVLWQACDERGELIAGKSVTLLQARHGALHAASHLWIWRRAAHGIEVLLQTRGKGALTWPGHLDISAAGHIDAGETPITTVLRETQEELGITINIEELRLLFVHHAHAQDEPSGIIEHEFQWVYGLELQAEMEFKLPRDEVSSVLWLAWDDFVQLITTGVLNDMLIVPHGPAYIAQLFEQIKYWAEPR